MASWAILSQKEIEYCEFPGGYSPYATRGACTFNWRIAKDAIRFFMNELRHVKGKSAGKPFGLAPWQQHIVGSLFGWRRPDDTRRYRKLYAEIPRKAGKSMLAMGIAVVTLYCDPEPGAEVYSCAADREQAAIVFETAKQNVLCNPELIRRSKVYQRSIVHYDSGGMPRGAYKALSAEAGTKHGLSPSTIIFDELHAQPNSELWDVMTTGVGARQQPLIVAITTAGHDRNSVCWQEHQLACNIRDGILHNETVLPVVYCAGADDDWTSPAVWRKANPNIGVSVPESFYADECLRARQSPRFENTFRNWYLNQWTEQAVRWFALADWDACKSDLPPLIGEPCWCGLDMSAVRDVTAFVMAFPLQDGYVAIVPHFWIPEETASDKEKTDRVPYRQWAQQGLVTLTNGVTVDHDRVRYDINKLCEKYAIQEIAADRWNATQILTQLTEQDGMNVVQHGQGYSAMNCPSKEFEKLVVSHKLRHDGNEVLRWMASNVSVDQDASGNLKPTKNKSTGRIDGIVAGIMAVGRAVTNTVPVSYYETHALEMG